MALTRFHTFLREKIEEAIESRSGSMASGACTDYPHYRQQVGHIQGLLQALAFADEIENEKENE